MTSENKKIQGIVKELLSNSLSADAKEININITKDNGITMIKVVDNGKGMNADTLKYVKRVLNQPQRKDMESYYEGLVGHSSEGSGLNLVGLLVDEANIESSENGTTVIVKRKG